MSTWKFDEKRFVEEVLKPVREGWSPGQDRFRAYLLPVDVSDQQVIAAALTEIGRQLNQPRYRAFAQACELLRAQHQESVATLTDAGRRRGHREQVRERAGKLTGAVRRRLDGAPALPASEVSALVKALDGAYTRTAVQATLVELGAAEREPVELPPAPMPKQWNTVQGPLAQLRHESVWAYLSDTPGLSGAATTTQQIQLRRERIRVSRSAESTAEMSVLKHVETWLGDDGGLGAVLRFEVVEALAREVEFGFQATLSAAKDRAGRLAAAGLPRSHADVAYAVWCAYRYGQREPEPAWWSAYQDAIQSRQLRTALEVLSAQPDLTEQWRDKAGELRARLAELDEERGRCRELERTDTEAAVEAYLKIREELADPGIDVAVERCRPAPPRRAMARVDGLQVTISWEPSPATAGRIGYRVSRGGTVLAEVGTGPVVDPRPPGGVPLTYSVSTLRDGNPSARVAVTDPVTVLREVEDLELRGGSDAIFGQWRLPEGAAGAVVFRSHGGTETALPATFSATFVDRDVRPGETYGYRVHARYRLPDGTTASSDGVLASGCQEEPVAVTDLHAEFDGDELVADWTPPPRGEVELLQLGRGDERPDRAVLPVERLRRYGTALRATGHGSRGFFRGKAAGTGRQLVLLPVTVLGDLAAIGQPCELDRRHGKIRELRALRLGPAVRLAWEWPDGAAQARVLWRRGAKPLGPTDPQASVRDVTKVDYDGIGVQVTAAPGEYWFAVCTMAPSGAGSSFGPLVLARESTTGEASYRVQRGAQRHRHPWRRRPWVLQVEAAGGAVLPPVVLVAKTGVRPMHVSDGDQVLRLEGGPSPLSSEFTLPPGLRRPVHLRAFPLNDGLVLIPSRPDELIVT
jgi:hypothetical protein